MKKLFLSCVAAATLSSVASADTLGAEFGYAFWSPSLTGDIKKGSDSLDFEKDLGYGDKENNSFYWAYLDHPFPLLPNIKIQQTNYTDKATGVMTKNLTFDNKPFVISEQTSTEFTLNQMDIIPYLRILDNWVNLDLGINLKNVDGNIKINNATNTDFSAIIPLLYAKVRFDLPFSGFGIETDISYLSLSGNKVSDMKAGIVYQSSFGLGANLGIRKENITLDDADGIYGKININGVYAGVFLHF